MRRLCLIGLLWLAATGGAWGASIAPSSAVGGPVPLNNTGGFTTWPAEPISIADLTDGSLATGVTLTGHDDYLQDNGARVDLGTFYVLRYELPLTAPAFHIEFTASVQDPYVEEFMVNAVHRNGYEDRVVQWEYEIGQPRTFGLTFYRDHNDGNQPERQSWGLDDLQQPDGSISFVLQGSYLGTLNHPGFMTTNLYEVTAEIVPAPEPGTGLLMVIGAVAAVALGRRRRAGGLEGKAGA